MVFILSVVYHTLQCDGSLLLIYTILVNKAEGYIIP